MKKFITKADLITAALITLLLPAYYKVKFVLDGQMSWRDTLSPDVWIEYLFSGLLACGLIFIHRLWRDNGRVQLFAVTVSGVAAAVIFTRVFFTVIFPLGTSTSFIFDIAILAILMPLLLSGVRDRIFLEEKAAASLLSARDAENKALAAQFQALKARVNPHFLFNSLNTLADIVEEDPKLASMFIDRMATVYRYILECQNTVSVPLNYEIEAAQALMFVFESRHPGALKISISPPEETEGYDIVPLALQTLVENALKHNIYSLEEPLEISIMIEGSDLVVDNTINLKPETVSLKIGLEDLKSRFAMISDRPLTFGETEGRFWVRAPLVSGHIC